MSKIIILGQPCCPACLHEFPKLGSGKRKFPFTAICRCCGAHFIRESPTKARFLTSAEWIRHKTKWPKPPKNIQESHQRTCERLWG